MSTPLLLLDVDGVLNAVSKYPDRSVWADWESGTAVADGVSWPILYSPSVIKSLRDLHESGRVEIQWLTTWGHDANGSLGDLLGMPHLSVAGTAPERSRLDDKDSASDVPTHADAAGAHSTDHLTGTWWKFDVVRSIVTLDPDRPLIWVDDDLRLEREIAAWMTRHTKSLLLAPNSRLGLTPKMLRQIAEFLGDE